LPSDDVAPGFLAHLHGVAPNEAPRTKCRVPFHGLPHLVPIDRRYTLALECRFHGGCKALRRKDVQVRDGVEASALVMRGLDQHVVMSDAMPRQRMVHKRDFKAD
jgi:hypothetical protein